MPEIPVPYPLQGLNDNYSTDAQPPLTTRDAQNERSKDPATNRLRGGQRAGLGRYSEDRLGAGPVRAVTQVTFDARQTDFAIATSSVAGDLSEWSTAAENGVSVPAIVHDSQAAKYVVDGTSSITKYNRDGLRVYTFGLPLLDEAQFVRALTIDDRDNIYVAVTGGGAKARAWIRAYTPDDEKNLVVRFEVFPGAFVEQLVLRDDKLYAALNDPSTATSSYVVYENLLVGAAPTETYRRDGLPYPVHGIDVNDAGDVFVASAPKTANDRFYNPELPDHTALYPRQRWDPTKLVDWDKRKYVWLRAEDLADLADGDEVETWADVLGRGNCVMQKDTTNATLTAPLYQGKGLGGKPAVRFTGPKCQLRSQPSVGSSANVNNSQVTLAPNRTGYLVVAVMQMGDNADTANNFGWLWRNPQRKDQSEPIGCRLNGYSHAGATANYDYMIPSPLAVIFSNGAIRAAAPTRASVSTTPPFSSGQGTGISTLVGDNYSHGFTTNTVGAAIVTFLCDGNGCTAGWDASYFRVNGAPIAKWASATHFMETGARSTLGCDVVFDRDDLGSIFTLDRTGLGSFFSLSELLVLQAYTDSAGVVKVATCPDVNAIFDYGATGYTTVGNSHDDSVSYTEVEQIEGYFAWKYGISHLLDDGARVTANVGWATSGPSTRILHPMTSRSTADAAASPTFAPVNPNGRGADTLDRDQLRKQGLTVKVSPLGEAKWVAFGGGMGYAVKTGLSGDVFVVGPRNINDSGQTATDNSNNAAAVRKLRDNNATVQNIWKYRILDEFGSPVDFTYQYPRLDVDKWGNVYVPYSVPVGYLPAAYSVVAIAADGDPDGTQNATHFFSYAAAKNSVGKVLEGRAVSVDPRVPDFGGVANPLNLPEFVALGCESTANANLTVHQVRILNGAPNGSPPRAVYYVGVCQGALVRFGAGAVQTLSTNFLSSSARFISAVNAYGKAFFTDGANYRYYDPKLGTATRWNAEDGGSLQPRYKLLTTWRGRMVLARGEEDPQNWQMSEAGNPFGWDFFPPDGPLATQAVIGNEAEIGEVPDVITSIIPYDRERLIFGCDHTIYMMWGDPMENGSIVLASDTTGMAFGNSWAKDAEGVVYFFGSRGGVYRMTPERGVQKLTNDTIDRRMQDIDLTAYNVTLVWDEDLGELRVLLCNRVTGALTPAHWAWVKQTNSWHQDRFSVADIQPMSATVFDSDSPDDRAVVFGSEDGWVRFVDRDAKSDDGRTIDSWVTVGPFADPEGALRLRDPKLTLGADQGGCFVELASAATPDARFVAQERAQLHPGDNPTLRMGVRGNYTWLRLRNAAPGQRWAYERGVIGAYGAGRRRS